MWCISTNGGVGRKIGPNLFYQNFSRALPVMDVHSDIRGRPHHDPLISLVPKDCRKFLPTNRLKLGWNLAQWWLRLCSRLAGCSRCNEWAWPSSGSTLARIWFKTGSNLAQTWLDLGFWARFGPSLAQGGPRTDPEPETGTAGTVFPGTESGTGTAGTVFQEPEPEPSSLFNCTETHKNPLLKGTAGTENRNRSNRSIPKP